MKSVSVAQLSIGPLSCIGFQSAWLVFSQPLAPFDNGNGKEPEFKALEKILHSRYKGRPSVGGPFLKSIQHLSKAHRTGGKFWNLRPRYNGEIGGPGVIRTPGSRFRKPLLYPSELQCHELDFLAE